MTMSLAHRRYTWRVFGAMIGYLATLLLANVAVDRWHASGTLAGLLAVLPALCVAAVFWALARLVVEERDEYQRMLLVRQLLVATGVTMTVITIWGFLSDFEIVAAARGYYPVWIFFFSLGIGA
ncbi:MAG: hypothetical protein ACJ8EZ_03810, partial [Sphingomicrobium sp.]